MHIFIIMIKWDSRIKICIHFQICINRQYLLYDNHLASYLNLEMNDKSVVNSLKRIALSGSFTKTRAD